VSDAKGCLSQRWSRLTIFVLSLAVKLPLAYVFLGSVDLVNAAEITLDMIEGDGALLATLPYVPAVAAFHWLAGVLISEWSAPLGFAFKLIPIVFDSFLAVLIYDFAIVRQNAHPMRIGLLYALCPLSILISSFHMQWEPVLLYFLVLAAYVREVWPEGMKRAVVYGLFFGASLLIKPIAVVLAPLLLLPHSGNNPFSSRTFYVQNLFSVAAGLSVLAVFLLVFGFLISNLADTFLHIFLYANAGYPVSGLPFQFPFSEFVFFKSRLWVLIPVLVIAVLYLNRRIGYLESAVAIFLLLIAFSGYAPQYLLWALPFLIVLGHLKVAVIYTSLSTVFLVLFYMNPEASLKANEHMGTFASLKSWAWLMPPKYLSLPTLLPVVQGLGNLCLPLAALLGGVFILREAMSRNLSNKTISLDSSASPASMRIVVAFTIVLFLLFYVLRMTGVPAEFGEAMADGVRGYHVVQIDRYFVSQFESGSFFNIVHVLGFGLAAWCWVGWRWGRS